MTLKLKDTNFINMKTLPIKDIYINKIVIFNKFPLGKQDFRYFVGYKILKKLDLYAYSVHK